MIEPYQLHDEVVKPVLSLLGRKFSQPAARTLIMGTIAHGRCQHTFRLTSLFKPLSYAQNSVLAD